MENRHLYHYCIERGSDVLGRVTIDGIAQLVDRITDQDSYRDFKGLIVAEESRSDPGDWALVSLSYLGREEL